MIIPQGLEMNGTGWTRTVPAQNQESQAIVSRDDINSTSLIQKSKPGEAVNKSAASAASPEGFSSRDQVGC